MPPKNTRNSLIAGQLDKMRKLLVDLSGRNRLINFRPQKRGSLKIAFPDIGNIYQRLIVDEKPLRLHSAMHEQKETDKNKHSRNASIAQLATHDENASVENDNGAEKSKFIPFTQDQCLKIAKQLLPVHLPPKRLSSNARYIRRQSIELIDETGTNHLYLALGFLRWFEHKESKIERISPLILLPITIAEHKANAATGESYFELEYEGAELTENLSLKLKLEEFSLSLPSFDQEAGVDNYLNQVSKLIRRQTDWEVLYEAHIAFFSFAKLGMYLDLDPAKWPEGASILDNPLIVALLNGIDNAPENTSYGGVEVHDEHPTATDIPLVCSADSSQHTAILKVREGKNTVIEGPPGTGKSQTITNIIAGAINDGKTVLFLSEKMAALSVVHENLAQNGLGDFCLELHSNKSRKNEVLKSIQQRKVKYFPAPRHINRIVEEWQEFRKQLSDYAKSVSTESGPWEESLFDTFGRVVSLRNNGLPSYRGDYKHEFSNWDTLNKELQFLNKFSDHLHNQEIFTAHPLQCFTPSNASPGDEVQIEKSFSDLATTAQQLQDIESELGKAMEFPICLSQELVSLCSRNFPEFLEKWDSKAHRLALSRIQSPGAQSHVRSILGLVEDSATNRKRASAILQDEILSDFEKLTSLDFQVQELESLGMKNDQLGSLNEILSAIKLFYQAIEDLSKLEQQSGSSIFEHSATIGGMRRVENLLKLIVNRPASIPVFFHPALCEKESAKILLKAKSEAEMLLQRKSKLESLFVIPDAPHPEIIASQRREIRSGRTSFFYRVGKHYRNNKRSVLSYLKDSKIFGLPSILDDLSNLETWLVDYAAYSNSADCKNHLGPAFTGVSTQWNQIEDTASWCNRMREYGIPVETITKMVSEKQDTNIHQLSIDIANALSIVDSIQERPLEILLTITGVFDVDAMPLQSMGTYLGQWISWFDSILQSIQSSLVNGQSTASQIRAAIQAAQTSITQTTTINNDAQLKELFAPLARGIKTPWNVVQATLDLIKSLRDSHLPVEMVSWLLHECFDDRVKIISGALKLSCLKLKAMAESLAEIRRYGSVDAGLLFGNSKEGWSNVVLRSRNILNSSRLLPQWINHHLFLAEAEANGLKHYLEKAAQGNFPAADLSNVYSLSLAETHCYNQIRKQKHLSTFDPNGHENAKRQFVECDKKLISLNKKRLPTKLTSDQPFLEMASGQCIHIRKWLCSRGRLTSKCAIFQYDN